jgi:hypothetical protein
MGVLTWQLYAVEANSKTSTYFTYRRELQLCGGPAQAELGGRSAELARLPAQSSCSLCHRLCHKLPRLGWDSRQTPLGLAPSAGFGSGADPGTGCNKNYGQNAASHSSLSLNLDPRTNRMLFACTSKARTPFKSADRLEEYGHENNSCQPRPARSALYSAIFKKGIRRLRLACFLSCTESCGGSRHITCEARNQGKRSKTQNSSTKPTYG